MLRQRHSAKEIVAKVCQSKPPYRRKDYSTIKPHSAIGKVPSAVYAELSDPAKQRDGSFELS
jgi:hypothetical protein